jgi:hypothetical protein
MEYIINEIEKESENEFIPQDFLNHDSLDNRNIIYEKYKVKELLKICIYYGLNNQYNIKSLKKKYLIDIIIDFENLIENEEMVTNRLTNWYFIKELLKDKKMRKYIFW